MTHMRASNGKRQLGIEEVSLKSFDEFTQYIGEKHWNTHGVWFRGQKEADWPLRCSLDRLVRFHLKEDLKESNPVVGNHLKWDGGRAFEAFGQLSRSLRSEDYWSKAKVWALAQHHGGCSPLLDWTRSPYVAAFFAFADVCRTTSRHCREGKKLAIWGLSRNVIEEVGGQHETSPQVFLLEHALRDDRRLIAQQGCFTYTDPIQDLDDWVHDHFSSAKGSDQWLWKITLPWSATDNSLTHLNRMNINYATLFPDLEGAALHSVLNAISPNYEGRNTDGSAITRLDEYGPGDQPMTW